MRKHKDTDQPTWIGVKRYVEGQLHQERRRLEAKVDAQLDLLKRIALKQFAILEEQIEAVARQAATYGGVNEE